MNRSTASRQRGSVTIVDVSGRIVIGEESTSLGKLVSDLLNTGHKQILLNLADVSCIDSAGFAYLIASLTSVRQKCGELKLLNPTKRVRDVMQFLKLFTVFDVRDDETAAVNSFGESTDAIA